jgi:hypothetical protein
MPRVVCPTLRRDGLDRAPSDRPAPGNRRGPDLGASGDWAGAFRCPACLHRGRLAPRVRQKKVPVCGLAANPHGRYARAWEQTCGAPLLLLCFLSLSPIVLKLPKCRLGPDQDALARRARRGAAARTRGRHSAPARPLGPPPAPSWPGACLARCLHCGCTAPDQLTLVCKNCGAETPVAEEPAPPVRDGAAHHHGECKPVLHGLLPPTMARPG